MKNQKLELTWIGKHKRPKLEARILLEDAEKSYHAATRRENAEFEFDNRLIYGDNLLALKALEQEFTGKVKCVFIDPPYNTGSAFTHYDDGLEHSIWLGLMRDRLEIIKRLLADDGSLWITIDDNEAHYLKVLCDEVFGRKNFVANLIWEKKRKPSFLSKIGNITDYVICYAKNYDKLNDLTYGNTSGEETYPLYNAGNPKKILTFPPNSIRFMKHPDGFYPKEIFKKTTSIISLLNELEIINGWNANKISLEGEWRYGQNTINEQLENGDYYVIKSLDFRPRRVFKREGKGKKIHNLISRAHYDMSTNEDSAYESLVLFGDNSFDYPKPEKLLEFIIEVATNPGDLVLDSFAGSGTTGAVAHKMGRRWIMVELGEHCHTHIIPRLRKVIDGTDQGGISKAVNWQGGGGFRYYRLAPTLIVHDRWGNDIINPDYNPEMLAEAMAKLEGFIYQPSPTLWWQHGHSSENDYLYVTTQTLSTAQLQALAEEVGPGRSLLICCSAWRGITLQEAAERFPNLTLKKIPKMVRERCEWGHDDYSLNVANLPLAEADQPPQEPGSKQGGLFDDGEDGDA
ncbi:site-specific DNA-methyltransferase [Cardiobacterium hominis]